MPTTSTTPIMSAGSRSLAARTASGAHPRPREDLLGDDGPGDELRQQQSDHRDDRDERVPERVAQDDDPAAKALCARRRDVVAVEHLQHCCSRVAQQRGGGPEPEHHRRQDQVLQEVRGTRFLAQGLDASAREDVQPDREDVDAGESEHEARRAAHEHRDGGQEVVELRVLPKRGDDAEGHPEHDGDHDRRAHQDQGGWDAFPDLLGDRSPRLDREAEVALDRGREPADISDRQRLIQAVLASALLEQLRVALDLLELFRRQASQQRIAWCQGQRDEADDRDPDQDRDRDQDSTKDVRAHRSARLRRRGLALGTHGHSDQLGVSERS